MRLVKVRIRAGDIAKNENQMVYPPRYRSVEVGRYGVKLNPASVRFSGDIGRGGSEEFCSIALPEALAEEYASDPDMIIIDSTTADTLMEQWRVKNGASEESVTDENRLVAIQVKQAAGITLSAEDMKALDLTVHNIRGINKTRRPVVDAIQSTGHTVNDDLNSLPAGKKTFVRGI